MAARVHVLSRARLIADPTVTLYVLQIADPIVKMLAVVVLTVALKIAVDAHNNALMTVMRDASYPARNYALTHVLAHVRTNASVHVSACWYPAPYDF